MKSKRAIEFLLVLFIIVISKSVFAIDGIYIEDRHIEIYEEDLNGDEINERIEIVREALTPSYISYYVYDTETEELLFSRENLYRGIVEIESNTIIERLPIYNDEFSELEAYYDERNYILEDNKVICISDNIKSLSDLIDQDKFGTYSTTHYTNPPRNEIEKILEEVALNKGIPPTILKAIAYTESNYRQFQNGKPLISFDGISWGIMQVTPQFYPKLDIELLKYDIRYNIEAGADILLDKWGYAFSAKPMIPKIGKGDIRVLEDWYFAIWAYNGFSANNNPNMIPYKHSSWTQYEAYQDKVLKHAKEILGQEILAISKNLLPDTGLPDPRDHFLDLNNSKTDIFRLFVENLVVKVNANSGLKLKDDNMENLKTISNGSNLRILENPILYDGYYRYKVEEIYSNGSSGSIGWVASNWILPNDNITKSFLVWQKRKDIPSTKTWNIDFNLAVDKNSVTVETIYIEDSHGNKIDLNFDNYDTRLKVIPVNLLITGEEYILSIKGVKTIRGNKLVEYIKMPFVVK